MKFRRFKKGSIAIYTLNELVTKEDAMKVIKAIEKEELKKEAKIKDLEIKLAGGLGK